jgi:hypothetical protein
MSAFFLCFAAWSAIALGMDRHHEDALGREAAAPRLARLRRAGWLLLALSLWLAARPPAGPASLGVTAWTVALSVAAVAVTAVMTWQPRRAPVLGGVALAAGLAAWAAGM